MWFGVISLFPSLFEVFEQGVVGRAKKQNLWQLELFNPRDYTQDAYKTIDDRPYGGGPGMLMMAEPLQKAIQAAKKSSPKPAKVIYLSPQGKTFNQECAKNWCLQENLILLCGRYEGIDERLLSEVDEEWSLGDFILSGGEFAAMAMIDSVIRLVPGVLGDACSAQQDSFEGHLLDCPHYTRPEVYQNKAVPQVLLSGDHKAIARWRLKQSLGRTWQRRPDLLAKAALNAEQKKLLQEFIDDEGRSE